MTVDTRPISRRLQRFTTAMLVTAILGLTPLAGLTLSAQSPSSVAKAAEPRGGPSEGIKVRGHWVIDVRDAAGRLVTHREFENALYTDGAGFLADLLARRASANEWVILLTAATPASPLGGTNPCSGALIFAAAASCAISESSTTGPNLEGLATQWFPNLTRDSSSGHLTLTGSAKSSRTGEIRSVSTYQPRCPSPDFLCTASSLTGMFLFSGTTLPSPIAIAQNQTIDVTVTISFS